MSEKESPFEVPPFSPGHYVNKKRYVWWGWHPNYPRWSQSCWGGATEEEARAALDSPLAGGMQYYHLKLIREEGDTLTEIDDRPCPRLDIWRKIAANPQKDPP